VTFNLNKLKGRLREMDITYRTLAEHLGIAVATVSLTFTHKRCFTMQEIRKTADLLGIAQEDIGVYFFTLEV